MRSLAVVIVLILTILSGFSQRPSKVERSNRMIRMEGRNFFVHTVKRKETLYSIAKAYEVSVDTIIKHNPHAKSGLSVRMTLLIARKEVKSLQEKKTASFSDGLDTLSADTLGLLKPLTDSGEIASSLAETIELGHTRGPRSRDNINVAMLLPFGGDKSNELNFVHFLQGALLAIDRLGGEGINIALDVLSTQNSSAVAQELISSGDLDRADLIIGPVYDEPFDIVAPWAASRRVPVVSPLGGTGNQNNPYVIAVAPSESNKNDKLLSLVQDQQVNVVYIESSNRDDIDSQMEAEILSVLPESAHRFTYTGKSMNISSLTSVLDRDRRNVLVIPISNQNMVEEILSRYSSFNSTGRYSFSVIGTSRWARFNTINQDLFFKLNTSYVTSYHSDRRDERVARFTSDYLSAFGSLPTLYSMRGYDVMLSFSRLMFASGRRSLYDLSSFTTSLLQVDYRFAQDSADSKFSNRNWVLVTYNADYTISVR